MPTKMLLLQAMLSLLFINKGWASEPIVEIEDVSISAFTLDGAMKPLLLQSFEEAAAYLDTKNLAVVKDKVDFSKQET